MKIVTALKLYNSLLNIEYELTLGHKGILKKLRIIFDKSCWFHLAGIHYLNDIDIIQNHRATEKFYDEILSGQIKEDYFKKSTKYNDIQERVALASKPNEIIEAIDNKLVTIYSFSRSRTKFYTTIDGDYLICDFRINSSPINLFLVFEKIDDNIVKPMSIFYPQLDDRSNGFLNYADGQPKYTLLLSTKIYTLSAKSEEIFRHPLYTENSK